MTVAQIEIPESHVGELCRRNGIRKLSFFGSVLTDRFSNASDVDILVEFEPDCRVGYFGLAAMERELSAVVGRKVDLRTPDELSRYFREDVLKAARVQYVRE